MTVQNTAYRADYTGNGVTKTFTVPFYFLDDTHLQVLLTNYGVTPAVTTTLTLNSDYTVSGAGDQAGGSITTSATDAYSSNYVVSILRDVPYAQETHYVEGDPFPAASHEKALDLLTMQNQQQQEQLDRSFKLSPAATPGTVEVTPTPGYAIGWDAGGNLVNVPNTGADQTAYNAATFTAKSDLSAPTGAGLVGYGAGTVKDALDSAALIPAAYQAADAVVTSAFQAADTAITAAFQAADSALSSRVGAVEVGQSAAVVGYDTQANLYANLVPVAGSVAYVTNDPTASKNGTYRKVGGTGTGSWVQSSYDRVALVESSSLSYRGTITPGTALSAITTPGTYFGAGGGGFTDLPAGWPTGPSLMLTVFDAFGVAGRFQLQEIREWSNPDNYQFRWMDHNNPTSNAWKVPIKDLSVTTAKLADGNVTNIKLGTGSVSNAKLADGYTYKGDLSAGSMNSVVATGRYVVTAQLTDAPSGSTAGGILDVHAHGIWVTQEFSDILDPSSTWRRMIRTAPSIIYPWSRIKIAGTPTIASKTVAFIGDSITELGDYPERIASRLGCTSLKFGFGGCRLGTRAHDTADNTNYDAMAMWSIATAINTGNFTGITAAASALFASNGDDNRTQAAALAAQNWSSVDYMVIFFGTNDWSGDNALGTTGDTTPATFRGAVNYITQKILSVYPNIKIAFVSPMWRSRKNTGDGLDADTNPNTNGVYLIQFADAVVEMAHLNKLPALDLYRESGINKYNASTLLSDGVHPVAGVGYQLIADKIASFLQSQF